MLLFDFPLGPAETNAFLVACPKSKSAMIIDPAQGSFAAITSFAKKKDFTLEKVLITHSHWDHIVDAAEFKSNLGLSVYIHPEDAGNLQNPGTDGLPLFFPVAGVMADGYFEEGDKVQLGEMTFKVLHTPGHSPGSCCFYCEKEGVIFTGDTLFQGAIGNISFPSSNPALMMSSLKRLKKLPSKTKVYPGHGDPTTIGAEQKTCEFAC